jgi:hypothetical protein
METLTKPRAGKRRKVLKDETAPDTPPPGAGHIGPDANTVLVWVGVIDRETAAVAAAKKKLAKAWKLALNDGVVRRDLERVMKMRDEDPETVMAEMSRLRQYAEWLGVPIGKQLGLFEQPRMSILNAAELSQKAHDSGYLLGITGCNPDDQAYPPTHEHHTAHNEGWHAGQAVLLAKIKPIEISLNSDAEADAAKAAARKPAKDSLDDDIDEAA